MLIIFWIIIFVISLVACIKGADWLLESSEKIGIVIGLSPFIIGVLFVGLGTSFPELIVSLIAVFKDLTEIPVSNAIGSNIANMLLVVGISAIVGKKLVVTKSLIDLNLPILAIGTVLFLGIVWDGEVTFVEALLLFSTYIIYFIYTIKYKDDEDVIADDEKEEGVKKERVVLKDILILILGVVFLALGSQYLIESIINISEILVISVGVITISAVALGTSIPELLVSIKAALQNKSDVALGNIFGSNVFNMLMVVGIPGLFKTLPVDEMTLSLGVPALAVVTLLFVISGISKRIHMWEGAFYLALYVLFLGKLFTLF